MLRFVTITVVAAALSSPALAEPGIIRTISPPLLGASSGLAPKVACELPVDLSARTIPALPEASHAMTLSPRMIQAIRIDDSASVD